jgi:hypothetical protein
MDEAIGPVALHHPAVGSAEAGVSRLRGVWLVRPPASRIFGVTDVVWISSPVELARRRMTRPAIGSARAERSGVVHAYEKG